MSATPAFFTVSGKMPRLGVPNRIKVLVAVIGQTPRPPIVAVHHRKQGSVKFLSGLQKVILSLDDCLGHF